MAAAAVIRAVADVHVEIVAEAAGSMWAVAETAAAAAAEAAGMMTAVKEIAASKTAAKETVVTGKETAVAGSRTVVKRRGRPEMRTVAVAEIMTGMEEIVMLPA